jgi:ABC-2 type transport system ATP-binding protein
MTTVAVNNLNKSYAETIAVDDLSFTVEPGEILGLIGPNGAGKSTTIKTILDFMKPDSGEISIFGRGLNENTKNQIGYLPEEKGLYHNLRAIDLIIYLASLKGMRKGPAQKKADELLERTGMFESRKKKIKEMSKGMGQMIQFIVTIIHDPQLLILDEPFSGLDPVNSELMKKMIGEMRNEGKAIILSTHQMNQVEELGDRVLMINHGKAVLYGEVKETRAKFKKNSIHVVVEGDIGNLTGVVEKTAHKNYIELVLSPETTPENILDQLRERNVTIDRFEVSTPSLNDIFLDIVGVKS